MESIDSRNRFLAEVASMYYDLNMTQQEIGERVGLTRSAISRILLEAREKGIVEIIVHHPSRIDPNLESRLIRTFNLKAARVLKRASSSGEDVLEGLGLLAAQYFTSIMQERDIVGISWGRGLRSMLSALRPMAYPNAEVVQLVGSIGTEKSSTVGPLLAPSLASTLGCACHYLHAPLITKSKTIRDALYQDSAIQESLQYAAHCTIALVGIGTTIQGSYNPLKLGYVEEEELTQIRQVGAIGLVCGRHYDIHGHVLDISINQRVIGVDLETLAKIDKVIGVAGEQEKVEAILGALRGGFVNVLITDEAAAQGVLELNARIP